MEILTSPLLYMQILLTSKNIINQLINLCENFTAEQYSVPQDLLMHNSIGKHIRHILEFYDLLKNSCIMGCELSYDKREHCSLTEKDNAIAVKRFKEILKWLDQINMNNKLALQVSYSKSKKDNVVIDTNIERELVYNIEHAIHHMAIIRIAIEKEYRGIKLGEDFGVAYSTVKHREGLCAH